MDAIVYDRLAMHGTQCTELVDIKNLDGGILRRHLDIPPDGRGELPHFRLLLPPFTKAVYYAPFQKYAINPSLDLWPEGYNQCHALPVAPEELSGVKRGGMFALFELTPQKYLALLPLVTDEVMAWLEGSGSGLSLTVNHFGNEALSTTQPLLAVAESSTPYGCVAAVWRLARQAVDSFRLREEKTYPELFEYLGWCTWEQYRDTISEELILKAIDVLDKSPIPIRWMLIDDGHLSQAQHSGLIVGGAGAEAPQDAGKRKLTSLIPDKEKFPNGWRLIQERIAQSPRIEWSGIWLNFNGYWGGISPENEMGELNSALAEISSGTLLPRDNSECSGKFYEAWIAAQAQGGFDFVKVDNETQNIVLYRGKCRNAVRAVSLNHQSLEAAASRHLLGLINCMAHNNLCAFNTRFSQLTRCSEDYLFEDVWRAKHHLHNSFTNMLWMASSVWGDHDMFHSTDSVAGGIMARSKAISGGPIYLSDEPAKFNRDLIVPLCLDSGRILRPLAPAVPLPDSIFQDAYQSDRAFQVIAPLKNRCAAWAAYNLTHPEKSVTATLNTEDYMEAGHLLGEEWEFPKEGLLCWNVKERAYIRLGSQSKKSVWTIPTFDDALWILVPIIKGWAVLGHSEKHLSPQCHEVLEITETSLSFRTDYTSDMLFWKEADAICCSEGNVTSDSPNFWHLELIESNKEMVVHLSIRS